MGIILTTPEHVLGPSDKDSVPESSKMMALLDFSLYHSELVQRGALYKDQIAKEKNLASPIEYNQNLLSIYSVSLNGTLRMYTAKLNMLASIDSLFEKRFLPKVSLTEHKELLEDLWSAFYPGKEKDWALLGFQRKDDPSTDFRATRLLGLTQLM